jgi:hypothetical protein
VGAGRSSFPAGREARPHRRGDEGEEADGGCYRAVEKKKVCWKEVREFGTLRTEEMSSSHPQGIVKSRGVWIWNMKLKSRSGDRRFADSASDLIVIIDKSIFEKVEFSSPVTKGERLFGTNWRRRFRISAKIARQNEVS